MLLAKWGGKSMDGPRGSLCYILGESSSMRPSFTFEEVILGEKTTQDLP